MAWPEKVGVGVFLLCIPLWILTLGRDWGVLGLAAISALWIWFLCRLIAFQAGGATRKFRSSTKQLQSTANAQVDPVRTREAVGPKKRSR